MASNKTNIMMKSGTNYISLILTALALIYFQPLFPQGGNIQKDIKKILKKADEEAGYNYDDRKTLLDNYNDSVILENVTPHINNKDEKTRRFIYNIISAVALRTADSGSRIQAVELLTTGNYFVLGYKSWAKRLKQFKAADFNKNARHNITQKVTRNYTDEEISLYTDFLMADINKKRDYYSGLYEKKGFKKREVRKKTDSVIAVYRERQARFVRHKPPEQDVILLAGFLNLSDALYPILDIKNSKENNDKILKWTCSLALARMGVTDEIHYVVDRVKTLELNDDVTETLLPDLVYVRKPYAFTYLTEILNSDKKLCTSTNPYNSNHINCAYRALEYITPVIRDFPLKTGPGGDLDTDNYPQALFTAREWFKENKNTYILKTDVY